MLNSFSFSPLDLEELSNYRMVKKLTFLNAISIIQKTAGLLEKPERSVLKEEFSSISHLGLGSSFRVIQTERGPPQASGARKTP
jgi:hypothetical protein